MLLNEPISIEPYEIKYYDGKNAFRCPSCDSEVIPFVDDCCRNCGQKIDWEGVESDN